MKTTQQQHTGAAICQPCPIARRRQRARRIALAALIAAGVVTHSAFADEPVQQIGAPPAMQYRVALLVVVRQP